MIRPKKRECDMVGCTSRDTEHYYGSWYCMAHYPRDRRKDVFNEGRDAQLRRD